MAKKKVESPKSFDELFARVECDTGLVFVDTPEETRLIREVFRKYKGHSVQFWSLTQGLIEIPKDDDPERFLPHDYSSKKARTDSTGQLQSRGNIVNTFAIIEEDCRKKIANDEEGEVKTIYVLRDADKFFQQPGPLRACRDLIYLASCASSSIIITGFGIQVPSDLEKDSVFIRIPYPTIEEIHEAVVPNIQKRIERHNRIRPEKDRVNAGFDPIEVARACAGLTEDQILNTIGYSTSVKREVNTDLILEEKRGVINKSDILEYWVCDTTLNDVGGFKELKDWFKVRKAIMNHPDEAKKFGAKPPKGIMLLGVQGSGKTYIAKSVAADLGVGVIKLEMGKVFAGLVGESVAPWEELRMYLPTGESVRMTFEEAYEHRDWILGQEHTLISNGIERQFKDSLRVQSYDRTGKAMLLPVQDVIRHKRTKDLVRVTTKSGRSVCVTIDHSLFTISGEGKLIEMAPSNMKEGTVIAVPANYAESDYITTVDLRKEIVAHGHEDKWLVEKPLDYLGSKVYDYTSSKSKAQYENGRPLNLSLIPKEELHNIEGAKLRVKNTEITHNVLFYITEDKAELMGWYTAEGSTTADRLRLHVHKDEVQLVEGLIKKCGYNCYSYQDNDSNGYTIFFGDSGLKRIFDYIDVTNKDRIPEIIYSLSKDSRKAYLRGLFSGDGGTSGKHIELSQSRKSIIKDIIDLLVSVDIIASSYPRLDGGTRVVIHSSIYKKKYLDEIGFSQVIKQTTAESILGDNDWGHKIPFFKKLKDQTSSHDVDKTSDWISYKNAIKYDLDNIVKDSDVYWDVVDKIEVLEDQPEYVYDISVPGNENFIAGNIICHNSEKRMRMALAQAAAAGGVVVIDEIDKGLSGAGSSDRTDGGTTSRVIGTLLTWMSEDHPNVFIIATANDISALNRNHPELLRKGRFDEIWFSDCPTPEEREEIFAIHIRRNGRDPSKFDLKALAEVEYIDEGGSTYTYTGAEIEYAVQDAIQEKFALGNGKLIEIGGKADINTQDIVDKLKIIKPITFISRDPISVMRRWASKNARHVSGSVEKVEKTVATKGKNINMRTSIDVGEVEI